MDRKIMETNACHHAALQVSQEAIARLIQWSEGTLPAECTPSPQLLPAVSRAKTLFKWDSAKVSLLHLLFDNVKLSNNYSHKLHYHPLGAIADSKPQIPYPIEQKPVAQVQDYKQTIQKEVIPILAQNWQNLSVLSLILEKYGSCLSFAEENVALVDMARITGAVAAALTQSDHPDQVSHLSLIAGDLSGIQKFIYTISSDGALKSLRARSFYLELVTEEVVQQLLEKLQLPRTSIIYAGGGNLYLLASIDRLAEIKKVQDNFNYWLREQFQNKVFLALDCVKFPVECIADNAFKDYWNQVVRQLNQQKSQKFVNQIDQLLAKRDSYSDRCRVCFRDDTTDLQRLTPDNDTMACPICREMFQLGDNLFDVNSMVRSRSPELKESVHTVAFEFSHQPDSSVYYHLFKGRKPLIESPEHVFLINNWAIADYQFKSFQQKITPFLLGNYGRGSEKPGESGFMRAGEMAEKATGISRVGYLRMDVDNLGKIFAQGLGDNYNLSKLAGLSRQLSYFFKVYLNSLAEKRLENLLSSAQCLTSRDEDGFKRLNLMFIYAGGDDLFVSASWDQAVEFAFDVYQAFRAYTGYNSDITLSGGISIDEVKFPLYLAAESSGEAEKLAKGNGRDSLGLFGVTLKWSEWLGSDNDKIIAIIHQQDEEYWDTAKSNQESVPLLGVLPFVTQILQQQLQPNYSRNFVRNLLNAAQLQEQRILELQQKRKQPEYEHQIQDLRYYLHLPQIAYTLARLPKGSFGDEFRQSLKSPYNAPYFRAIATWIELLTRESNYELND